MRTQNTMGWSGRFIVTIRNREGDIVNKETLLNAITDAGFRYTIDRWLGEEATKVFDTIQVEDDAGNITSAKTPDQEVISDQELRQAAYWSYDEANFHIQRIVLLADDIRIAETSANIDKVAGEQTLTIERIDELSEVSS